METYFHNDPRIRKWINQIIERIFTVCILTGVDSDEEFQKGCQVVMELTSLLQDIATFPSDFLADGVKQLLEQQLPDPLVINNFPEFKVIMDRMLREGIMKATNSVEDISVEFNYIDSPIHTKADEEALAEAFAQVEALKADAERLAEVHAEALAQAHAKAEAKAKADEEALAEAFAQLEAHKADAKRLAEVHAEALAQAHAQAEAKAKADEEALAEAVAQLEAHKADAERLAEAHAEAIAQAHTQAEVKAKEDEEALAEALAQLEAHKAAAERLAEAHAEALAQAHTQAEVKAKADEEALAEAVAQVEAHKAEAERQAEAHAEALAQAHAKAEAKAKADALVIADALAQVERSLDALIKIEHYELAKPMSGTNKTPKSGTDLGPFASIKVPALLTSIDSKISQVLSTSLVPQQADLLGKVLSNIFPKSTVYWNKRLMGQTFLAQVDDILICIHDPEHPCNLIKFNKDGWKVLVCSNEDLAFPRRLEREIKQILRSGKKSATI